MLSSIFTPGLLQCYLCVAALFMKPLPKRKNFPARLGISAVLCLLCAVPLSAFHSWASVAARQLPAGTEAAIAAASGVEMLLYLLVVTAFFAVCCDISLLRAAYCAACAYLTQDLAYTIFVFFLPGVCASRQRDQNSGKLLAGTSDSCPLCSAVLSADCKTHSDERGRSEKLPGCIGIYDRCAVYWPHPWHIGKRWLYRCRNRAAPHHTSV